MKLNKNFIGINYFKTPDVQQAVIDSLMDRRRLQPILEIANWTEEDLDIREKRLKELHINLKHKIYYINK